MKREKKRRAVRTIEEQIFQDTQWVVRFGSLRSPRHETVRSLFEVVGEKLPFEALPNVNAHLGKKGIRRQGIYVALDSMGCARYIGRGRIFPRLRACKRRHRLELKYFSFYVVSEKKHEREIETLLIHSAGPLLQFNTQKKRVTLSSGNIRDYEAGTLFFQRYYRKGSRPVA